MDLEAYKKKYNVVFTQDVEISRKFMPKVYEILDGINFPKEIRNNEGTELDLRGYDLTIKPIQLGIRVRRFYAVKWDQFTQDDKERQTMSCDYYFLGYITSDESGLYSFIVFDGKDYEQKRDAEEIPVADRQKNGKHSSVWFNCYRISDIVNHCRIYAKEGNIGFKQITEPSYVERCVATAKAMARDGWKYCRSGDNGNYARRYRDEMCERLRRRCNA
jgi:hypothetical protein